MDAGRELDALIAETFFNKKDDGIFITWVGKDAEKWAWWKEVTDEYGDGWKQEFKPSTDIAAALPVLEVLRQRYFSTKIIMWDHTDKVAIVCHKRQGHDENLGDLEVEADTLPLAICLAALKAKGVEV